MNVERQIRQLGGSNVSARPVRIICPQQNSGGNGLQPTMELDWCCSKEHPRDRTRKLSLNPDPRGGREDEDLGGVWAVNRCQAA